MVSLRTYLAAILILLIALPVGVFWSWPHSRALQVELDGVKDRHLLLANNVASSLQRYHRDVISTFEFISDELAAKRPSAGLRSLMQKLKLRNVCLVRSSDGRVLSATEIDQKCPDFVRGERLAKFVELAGRNSVGMSSVEGAPDGRPVICLARAIGDRIAVAALDTGFFVELGRSIAFGVRGHAVIVDNNGHALAHPKDDWVTARQDLSKVATVQKLLAGGRGVDTFHSPAFNDDMVAGYASVTGTGWGVMIPQPLSELRDKAKAIERHSLLIYIAGLLLAALVAVTVAVLIARPLEAVTRAAGRMAEGEGAVTVQETGRCSPIELGALTRAFNGMAERIAQARRAESEARCKADTANESKTEFLRTVTHELRSPLNAIIGFSELLARDKDSRLPETKRREYARDIGAGARHLLSLTNDLLDLARIEAGRYELVDETVAPGEIAHRVARFIETDAGVREMTVSVDAHRDLPDVRADQRALFQCVLNLASNAVRYGRPAGNVSIAVRDLPSGDVEIVVADDGPGIAEGDLDRVLRPFERVANSMTHSVRGSGLGLPIVKQLAELHGGRFTLESTVGVGTRARIVLPRDRVLDLEADDPVAALPPPEARADHASLQQSAA